MIALERKHQQRAINKCLVLFRGNNSSLPTSMMKVVRQNNVKEKRFRHLNIVGNET